MKYEAQLRVRFWGGNTEYTDEEVDGWTTDAVATASGMIEEGFTEGELSGPGGERGWWEINKMESED